MTSYREILRLHSEGLSQRSIAASRGCGKGTVQRTVEHAKKRHLVWPLPPELTDARLRELFSPATQESRCYKEPDYEWVHREMSKSGVTLSLLRNEYCAGVLKNTKAEVALNRTYQEMAEHYGTAVLPARVRKPKDKPSVEGAVGVISTWIIAALRS